jgi:hypothetical protein
MKKVFVVIDNKVKSDKVESILNILASKVEYNRDIVGIQTLAEDISVSFLDSFPKKLLNRIISKNLNNKVLNGFSFAYGDALKKIKEMNIKLELDRSDIGKIPKEQKEIYDIIAEVHDIYLFDFNCTSIEEIKEIIDTEKMEDCDYTVMSIGNQDLTSIKNLKVVHLDPYKEFNKIEDVIVNKLLK